MSRGTSLIAYAGIIFSIAYGASVGVYTDRQLAREARTRDAQLASEAKTRAAVLAHEADVREREVCGVIHNVHNNARFRFRTEQKRVEGIVDYLADPDVRRDGLYRRVSATLLDARADRDVARDNVEGTEPPPHCDND